MSPHNNGPDLNNPDHPLYLYLLLFLDFYIRGRAPEHHGILFLDHRCQGEKQEKRHCNKCCRYRINKSTPLKDVCLLHTISYPMLP